MKHFRLLLMGFALLFSASLAQAQCPTCDPATNLVTNPDFSAGNTGFTSTLTSSMTCAGGTYWVGSEPRDKCTNTLWIDDLWDHTQGNASGSYMLIDGNGGTYNVWQHTNTINVVMGQQYTFSFWNISAISDVGTTTTETFEARVNGTTVIGTFNTAGAGQQTWTEYCTTWTATYTGTVTVSLWQTGFVGWNDYGLDDFYFGTCQADCGMELEPNYQPGEAQCEYDFSVNVSPNAGTTIIGYYWDFGDGTSSTLASPSHIFPSSGVYEVCVTVYGMTAAGECCSETICFEVEVECDPEPCEAEISDITVIDPGDGSCDRLLQVLVSANRPIIGYFWDFGDGTTGTSAGNSIWHQFPGGGTYIVCVTVIMRDVDGECCVETRCFEVNVSDCDRGRAANDNDNTLESTQQMAGQIMMGVFPNPGKDEVSVYLKSDLTEVATVTVLNIEGRQMLRERASVGGSSYARLNMSDLPSGVYIIRVQTSDQSYTQNWIKQ